MQKLNWFTYINVGLAVLLILIGSKLLLEPIISVPILASVGVIVIVIGTAIAVSVWHNRRTDDVPSLGSAETPGVRS